MATWAQRLFGSRKPKPIKASYDEPQRVAIEFREQGASGTDIFSGYFAEEYLQNLRGTAAADLWDQMRRGDPKIKMALSAIKNPIMGAHWSVNPANDSEEAKLHAEFIHKILFEDLNWMQSLSEILTMLDFGFSLFEVTHKICINDPKFGSHIGLRKLGWRSPRTVETWNVNECGDLESVTQQSDGDLQRYVDIPAKHLIVFTLDKEGDNYEGISALRPCYGPWKRKQTMLKLMIVGIEKHAFQVPILTIPTGQENSTTAARAKLVLEAYLGHQSQYITKPEGYTLELSKSDFDPDPILNAIAKEDAAIAHAFLENFLELGQSGSGSYALSYDLSDFFLVSIEHVAKYVANVLNRGIVCDLIKLNFGPQAEYPTLDVSGIRDKPGQEFANTLAVLINSKAIVPDGKLEEDLRKRYGLPLKSAADQREIEETAQLENDPNSPWPQEPIPKDADPTLWFKEKPKKLAAEGYWQTAGDEKVCELCDPLDGSTLTELNGKRPPLHDNCRCDIVEELGASIKKKVIKLADNGTFKVHAIEVSKKIAITQVEAVRIVQEFGLDSASATESEFGYRYEQCPPAALTPGSLKSFEAMEGVMIYYGRALVPAPVKPVVDQK